MKQSFNVILLKRITLHCRKVLIAIFCNCNQVVQLLTDFFYKNYTVEVGFSACVHANIYNLLLWLLQGQRKVFLSSCTAERKVIVLQGNSFLLLNEVNFNITTKLSFINKVVFPMDPAKPGLYFPRHHRNM